jgi:hypothetical protein
METPPQPEREGSDVEARPDEDELEEFLEDVGAIPPPEDA